MALALLLAEKQEHIGHLVFFFPSSTSLPSLHLISSSHLSKKEGNIEQRGMADLTAIGTICQTIWLLSSPDKRQEVRR